MAEKRKLECLRADDHKSLLSLIDQLESFRIAVAARDPDSGNTLLHSICEDGKMNSLRALMGHSSFDSCWLNVRNLQQDTPLLLAVRNRNKPIAEKLLTYSLFSSIVPLPYKSNSEWAVGMLLEAGEEKSNCLHVASSLGEHLTLDFLLATLVDNGAAEACDRRNAHGWTPFHCAVYYLHLDCIRTIVKRLGAQSPLIHARTSPAEETAIHLAVQVSPLLPLLPLPLLTSPLLSSPLPPLCR